MLGYKYEASTDEKGGEKHLGLNFPHGNNRTFDSIIEWNFSNRSLLVTVLKHKLTNFTQLGYKAQTYKFYITRILF